MPGRPAVDYDHHRARATWDPDATHAELRSRCPVAHTEHHDGYWVVTSHEGVVTCARDAATFSSDHDLDGSRVGIEFQGIGIPAEPTTRSIPAEVDGAEWLDFRRLLQPWFTPGAAARWSPQVRAWAEARLDDHLPHGRIDLVLDLANPVPAMFTLALVGLPVDEWERYAVPLHSLVYAAPGSPEKQAARTAIVELRTAIADAVAERRRTPRHDLASAVVGGVVAGRPVSDADAVNVLFGVVSGGVDTTTALLANTFVWLHEHPAERSILAAEPWRRAGAREEFLRVFSPAPATARTTTRDVEVGDAALRQGERVLLSWTAANRDPAVFPDPDEVRIDRNAGRHVAFGLGPHRCVGATFARAAFDAVLDVVLDRIPDYVVDMAGAHRYARVGAVNGWETVPCSFAPRPPAPRPAV